MNRLEVSEMWVIQRMMNIGIMDPKNKKFNGPRKGWSGETVILYHKGRESRIPWPYFTWRGFQDSFSDPILLPKSAQIRF